MDEEQAVSRLMLGPFMLKNQETLLDRIAEPVPVLWYKGRSSGSQAIISL